MKKLLFVTTFISIIAVAAILFSCEKEEQPDLTRSDDDIKTEQKIIGFVNDVDNFKNLKSSKSTGDICIDSAVWYIEAGLNYTYGYPEYTFNGLYIDSSFVKISFSGDESVLYSDVINSYKRIIDSLRVHYRKFGSSDKFLHLVDITPVINTSRKSSAGSIELKVTSYVGQKALAPGDNPLDEDAAAVQFDDTDYWKWGFSLGKCGSYAGESSVSDAAQEITWRVNYTRELTGVVYTDIDYLNVYSDEYRNPDEDTFDGMYDYLMFGSESTNQNFHDCLCPDEMKFYYQGFKKVIEFEKSNIPAGKSYISAEVYGDMIAADTWTYYCHNGKIKFGRAIIPGGDRKRLKLE